MKKIHTYVLRELLPPFLICLVILTFIVFAREVARLIELVIGKNVPFNIVMKISLSLLPGILIFTVPMSFLIGTIIGFSRLSSDGEIVAFRASGVGLFWLLKPTLFFAAAVWLLTSLVSVFLFPLGNDTLRKLTYDASLRQPFTEFHPRVFNEDLPNMVLYIHNIPSNRSVWEGIFLADTSLQNEQRIILAEKGNLFVEPLTRKIQLHLENGTIYKANLDEVEKDSVSKFKVTELAIPTPESHLQRLRPKKTEETSTVEILKDYLHSDRTSAQELLIELNTRFSLPVAAWVFALLGLTLGIHTRKGGRASGLVLGIFLIMLYYNLFLNGKRLAGLGKFSPVLGVWQANIIFFLFALLLLPEGIAVASYLKKWTKYRPINWVLEYSLIVLTRILSVLQFVSKYGNKIKVSLRNKRVRLMQIISLYISRGFLGYFILSLVACSSVFMIFTLFSLINDIVKNHIPMSLVIDYFRYLLPQMLMLIIPVAILLATLINFGILEKSNQVTAFKASGISLYQLAIPIFLLSIMISTFMYLVQEYIEPYANQRQDNIRHIIKGRPPQTAYRPEKKWIFGEYNRIYNYAYFNPNDNLFAGFSVFLVDLKTQTFINRIYAARANWSSRDGWLLENGWVRRFGSENVTFRKFGKERFYFAEQGSYFRRELLEPKETSKMTYATLGTYIAHLHKSGFDVTPLQVELYKKISMPISAVIMAVIGVPFSFSVGKKGAFHGVALGIILGIIYWGTMNLFEALGSYGLLAPLLSAWAPNIIYGAAGLYLLFTIRS